MTKKPWDTHPHMRTVLKNWKARHTYKTVALMNGVNPAYIARKLGHANTAMLFKHYAKWIYGADSGLGAGKMNTAFGPKMVPKKYRRQLSQRLNGGSDGARTRDLRRDRPTL